MIGLVTELLLCVLLATTIGYCILLDRRLRMMRADEQSMRKTILDLMTATESAERAVAGLRGVVRDCDETISGHLEKAERQSKDLMTHIQSGDDVIARISRIVETARGGVPRGAPAQPAPTAAHAASQAEPQPVAVKAQSRLAATLAAAQSLAQRRMGGSSDAALARGTERGSEAA
jgi:Domain of unknown function (DUF6468)